MAGNLAPFAKNQLLLFYLPYLVLLLLTMMTLVIAWIFILRNIENLEIHSRMFSNKNVDGVILTINYDVWCQTSYFYVCAISEWFLSSINFQKHALLYLKNACTFSIKFLQHIFLLKHSNLLLMAVKIFVPKFAK